MNDYSLNRGPKGKLVYFSNSGIWVLTRELVELSIASWADSSKGPFIELELRYNSVRVMIVELLVKNFDKELDTPQSIEETAKKVFNFCTTIIDCTDFNSTDYYLLNSIRKWLNMFGWYHKRLKQIHIYYGFGLNYGIRIKGKSQIPLKHVPNRCLKFPGTRLDADI